MRVLLFGANGMLGHVLYRRLKQAGHEVHGTIRGSRADHVHFGIFEPGALIENFDASDPAAVASAFDRVRPDVAINAIGLVKQRGSSKNIIEALNVNSIFPHRAADAASALNARFITISTDCVFDGLDGNYSEQDKPNAGDIYGMSKRLGEITTEGNSLTLRTSMIGRELATQQSIVEWFLGRRGETVNGYTNAIYSGVTTLELSDTIAAIIYDHPGLRGVLNLAGDKISKYDLLGLLNDAFRCRIMIEADPSVVVDRSLDASKFRGLTGIVPPSWPEMIQRMANDPTPYDVWHSGLSHPNA